VDTENHINREHPVHQNHAQNVTLILLGNKNKEK